MDRERLNFILRRLHGVSGIVPIGAFLLEHFFTNAKITVSAEEWTHAAQGIQRMPFLVVMEICFIIVPILFHALYGFYIWREGRMNPGQYSFFKNWMFALQRVTGLILFVYIGYHVYHTRFNWVVNGVYPGARYMHNYFNEGLNPLFYTVGILAAAFHFANGLWNVSCKWGITVTPQAQRLAGIALGGFGVALAAAGLIILKTFMGLNEEELRKADALETARIEMKAPANLAAQANPFTQGQEGN